MEFCVSKFNIVKEEKRIEVKEVKNHELEKILDVYRTGKKYEFDGPLGDDEKSKFAQRTRNYNEGVKIENSGRDLGTIDLTLVQSMIKNIKKI